MSKNASFVENSFMLWKKNLTIKKYAVIQTHQIPKLKETLGDHNSRASSLHNVP